MLRFLKVRGKPGLLVANPWALDANPRRYAGQQQVVKDPVSREHADRYHPVDEVMRDETSLRKATAKGDLIIIATGDGESVNAIRWHETHNAPPLVPKKGEKPGKDG